MDAICDDETTARLLREQLTSPLPKDSFLLDSVLLIMGRLGCDARSLAGKSLGQVRTTARNCPTVQSARPKLLSPLPYTMPLWPVRCSTMTEKSLSTPTKTLINLLPY